MHYQKKIDDYQKATSLPMGLEGTIIFVSHSFDAIRSVYRNTILIPTVVQEKTRRFLFRGNHASSSSQSSSYFIVIVIVIVTIIVHTIGLSKNTVGLSMNPFWWKNGGEIYETSKSQQTMVVSIENKSCMGVQVFLHKYFPTYQNNSD